MRGLAQPCSGSPIGPLENPVGGDFAGSERRLPDRRILSLPDLDGSACVPACRPLWRTVGAKPPWAGFPEPAHVSIIPAEGTLPAVQRLLCLGRHSWAAGAGQRFWR